MPGVGLSCGANDLCSRHRLRYPVENVLMFVVLIFTAQMIEHVRLRIHVMTEYTLLRVVVTLMGGYAGWMKVDKCAPPKMRSYLSCLLSNGACR